MRLRVTLTRIAMLASTGSAACGSVANTPNKTPVSDAGEPMVDTGTPDVAIETGPTHCGGCGCGSPPNTSGTATPDQACQIAYGASFAGDEADPNACTAVCVEPGGSNGGLFCSLPSDYQDAVYALADAGAGGASDASVDGGRCPAWTGKVIVQCGYACLGRRTEGVPSYDSCASEDTGEAFAARAYLEAVSVHAFARLEGELAAHGSPTQLQSRAHSARRDEARHTRMMTRLARRYGRAANPAPVPHDATVRPLFVVARENAVEGCIRETYGAVVGLIEARVSRDPVVRRAMRSIAADECRHAELSWAVDRWASTHLSVDERREVTRSARAAVDQLAAEGDARIVRELAASVWREMLSGDLG